MEKTKINPHAIFIVGAPRSGTTLLAEKLSRHDSVFVFNETLFYDAVSYASSKYYGNDSKIRLYIVNHLMGRLDARFSRDENIKNEFGARFLLSEIELIKQEFQVGSQGLISNNSALPDFLTLFMQIVCKVKGKQIWGEKTPNHLFKVEKILDDFPNVKIINVIRDPWAFLLSYKFAWRQKGGTLENKKIYHPIVTSLMWKRYVKVFEKFSNNPNNLLTIRFEDLVSNAEDTIDTVCNFIDVSFNGNMINISGSNSSFSGAKENLSIVEKCVCGIICNPLAQKMGYTPYKRYYSYILFIMSSLTLPFYFMKIFPILKKRFGGVVPYLRARNII